MIFKSLMHQVRERWQAICDLEGGDEEVLHLYAFGKDLGITIRVDVAQTGVVIMTRNGMYRQAIQLKED
jgi:hypothetical protein